MLWECSNCRCQGIADSLEFCPHCLAPRPVPTTEQVEETAPKSAPTSARGKAKAADAKDND